MTKSISENINFKIYLIFILVYGNLFLGWSFQNLTILGIPIIDFDKCSTCFKRIKNSS